MLRDSFRGSGGVAVIGGLMTSGKTTLLHTFCEEAASEGAVVLTATASREEEGVRFGVVRQLLQDAPAPVLGAEPNPEPGDREPAAADRAYTLGAELLALSADRPVVVAVDDAQFLDSASLECILVVARRVRSARVLVVATNCGCSHERCRRFLTRVGRLPYVTHVRLKRLSVAEVEVALRHQLGDSAASAMAPSCHEITGGNPLLVDALARDTAAAGSGDPARARPSQSFREAVLSCVDRCSPESQMVLHTAALLGRTASTDRIEALVGLDRSAVAAHLHTLEAAGLLTDGQCLHAAIAAAVTDSIPRELRRTIHRRHAQLLYEENAAATDIARQLIAAGLPSLPWTTEVLWTAANELVQDDPEAALECLRTARRLAQNEDERATLTMMLISLGRRTRPAVVRRYLPELSRLLSEGLLGRPDAESAIRYLLWFGRMDDAVRALERLLAAPPDEPHEALALRPFVLWLSIWYPEVVRRVPAADALRSNEELRTEAVGSRMVEYGKVFDLMLRNGKRHEIAAEAERLLESCRLADDTLDTLVTALIALLGADEPEGASRWSDALVKQAQAYGGRIAEAQFISLRAEIAFREGQTEAAALLAEEALAQLSAEDWGVGVGLPLGTLVRAHTELGNHDRAAELLNESVPPEMFETGFGMFYLQARGRFLLVTGDPRRARLDFQACWDFMRRRNVDLPNVLPWRVHLAETHLELGDHTTTRELAEQQMTLTDDSGAHWARGLALRILAGISEPGEARSLLTRSVQELREGGAQADLDRSLGALGRCCQGTGDTASAARVDHGARGIATASVTETTGAGEPNRLSTAELRVAEQAVRGYTNVQIAARLFVTVSTVEQHLTHVYRKLRIQGRTELASALGQPAGGRAGG
ncbi:AAA family ATPase [Streptomyces sp. NPDC047072]|uniref:AAA family ATPase n=1 Tax=Streptomyces sp. NPDC047072 TaxID=3154809 RepID=UPI0033E71C84